VDTSVVNGTEVCYVVAARNSVGPSADSSHRDMAFTTEGGL
jgi:hypothetical protein